MRGDWLASIGVLNRPGFSMNSPNFSNGAFKFNWR